MTAEQLYAGQKKLSEMGLIDILVIAPAGCGKTQALAGRATSLVLRREVQAPRKLLAVTFTNKARDGLKARIGATMLSRQASLITVTNLHGLATRVFKAHGGSLGLPIQRDRIERMAHLRLQKSLGIAYGNQPDVDACLVAAKRGLWPDEEVLARLEGDSVALKYELALRAADVVDYDDLIRYGARILAQPSVAALYRNHFAGVLVDEVQDLTMLQLGMVNAIGAGRTTFAGDPAQGIYAFAGGDPEGVFGSIRAAAPAVVTLSVSYRSSPAVLKVVNAIAGQMCETLLTCADPDPDAWDSEAKVTCLIFATLAAETDALVRGIKRKLEDHPEWSIGILGRSKARFKELVSKLGAEGHHVQNWTLPEQSQEVHRRFRTHLTSVVAFSSDPEAQLDRLSSLCRAELIGSDPDLLDEVIEACEALRGHVRSGQTLTQAVAACRVEEVRAQEGPISPGVHALTGHASKGHEFDLVIVVGMEEGHIPSRFASTEEEFNEELRVLHVMASRAKTALVFTRIRGTGTDDNASRWCSLISPDFGGPTPPQVL